MSQRTTTTILTNNVSTSASFDTSSMDLNIQSGVSFYVKWTKTAGTLAGTADIKASNDNINFVSVVNSSGASVAQTIPDASSDYMFNIADIFAKYVKVSITLTGGTATFFIVAHAKQR